MPSQTRLVWLMEAFLILAATYFFAGVTPPCLKPSSAGCSSALTPTSYISCRVLYSYDGIAGLYEQLVRLRDTSSPHDVRHIAQYGTIFCLAVPLSACGVSLRIHHCASLAEQSSIEESIHIMVELIPGGEGITHLRYICSTAERQTSS